MASFNHLHNPNYAPTGTALVVPVSVAASTSATPAMAFRGMYFSATATVSFVDLDNNQHSITQQHGLGAILWIAGKYVTLTASATANMRLVR